MDQINKNTPIPLYFQLQEILQDKLENGIWKPGDRFPSEEELCNQYGLSRTTVRNALHRLELAGMIERSRGKGTVVARPKVREFLLQSVVGSYASAYPQGGRLSTIVLEAAVVIPPDHVRSALRLNEGQKTIKLVRIRNVDGEPLFWTTAHVPFELCPTFIEEDFQKHSFFEILEIKYGFFVTRSVRTVTTVLATNRETNYLGVEPGSPLNMVESVSFLEDNTPIEYSRSYFRSDRTKFEVVITRSKNGDDGGKFNLEL